MNVDLSLSRHDEGTYLELPRKTEEQDRVTGRHWVNCGEPGGLVYFIHILGVLDSEDNLTRYDDSVTTRQVRCTDKVCIKAGTFTIVTQDWVLLPCGN